MDHSNIELVHNSDPHYNRLSLVWYSDVRYSKGGLVFRLNLVRYSNSRTDLNIRVPYKSGIQISSVSNVASIAVEEVIVILLHSTLQFPGA